MIFPRVKSWGRIIVLNPAADGRKCLDHDYLSLFDSTIFNHLFLGCIFYGCRLPTAIA